MRVRAIAILAVVWVFASGSTSAQDLRNKLSFIYSASPTPQVTVTNNHSKSLTGMVIVVPSVAPGKVHREIIWLDAGVNFKHDIPLKSGESRTFPVRLALRDPAVQPQLMAVSFDDLTSGGDDEWVEKLHARRKAAYEEAAAVAELLKEAQTQKQPNEQILASLNSMRTSLRTSVSEPEARAAAGLVISMAESNLKEGGDVSAIGDPQKTIPILLPMLDEWRGALKRCDASIT